MKALEAEKDEVAGSANNFIRIQSILDAFENSIKDGSIVSPDDYTLMRSVVDHIIVRSHGLEIIFKCRVTIEKEYVK